jgi:isopentenyl diphosphate isomerase/L-lactate dehydrogenase-like FMN-dependent dehydrogenase
VVSPSKAVAARIQLFLMALRVAIFCVGARNLVELQGKELIRF